MKRIKILSEEHWHGLRGQHLSGTDVSCILGINPWKSRFQLWHEKAGIIEQPDLSNNERVKWGKILEEGIAKGVAAQEGWKVRKVNSYLSERPDSPLGGSLDYEAITPNGKIVLEIKTAGIDAFAKWDGEPPLYYVTQVMTYLGLTGYDRGIIAVLVGGNALHLFPVERRQSTIDMIRQEAIHFWESLESRIPPEPDFSKDGSTLLNIHKSVGDKTADMTGNNRLSSVVADYMRAQADESDASARKSAAKAEITSIIRDNKVVITDGYKIVSSNVAGKSGRIITEADLGQTIGGKKSFRQMRIYDRG